MAEPDIVVICGGVGAARFLKGLVRVVAPERIAAVVNVADDMVLHGLHISPDLDTVMYTLAEEIDPDRGWGLRDETWAAMETLGRYGDRNWFNLGDRDLGTHLQRTGRLGEGASLTTVTQELAASWELELSLLPVTDDAIRTRVTRSDTDEELSFQEYFVGQQHGVPVSDVRFVGIEDAKPTDEVLAAIDSASAILIAPSNPIVSIAPVLDVPGVRNAIAVASASVVAVSPIIGGAAIKGPAANMLRELGHDPSATGVARLLADLVDVMVIDDVDAALATGVRAEGVVPWVTNTIMSDPEAAAALARTTLAAAMLGGTDDR